MKKIFSFLVLLVLTLSVSSQTDYTIGSGTGSNTNTSYACPIQDYFEGSRSQYLYLASELQAAGMTAGLINSIKFDVSSLNNFSGTVEQYTISIGASTASVLSATSWEPGTTSVYGPIDYVPVVGTNEFIFSAPFFWDGTSNIIVEICNGDPNSAAPGNTTWTGNPSSPWTTGLGFNCAHTYRADNVGYACGTSAVAQTGTLDTRPDITFSWSAAIACSGSPIAGVTSSSKTNVCVNEAFGLSVTNGFVGTGLTYQWQDSSAATGGVWHNITNATNFSYYLPTGISINTCYRRKTTCTNGNQSVFTTKICITVKPFYECYCNPLIGNTLYTNSTTLEINSVGITGGSVNYSNAHTPTNPTPSLGYASFVSDTSALQLKQGVVYTATVGTSITPTGAAMWVDWNHNNIFDSSEYSLIRYDAGVTSASVDIDVPANAQLGLTMVRFRTANTTINYNNPCTSYTNGETEDYLVKIVPGTPCSGTPTGGTAISTVDSICPNNPFKLSVQNGTEGVVNLLYQWESQTNCTGAWTPISGATGKTYTVPSISGAMCFRRKITCGANSVYSASVTVNIKPTNNCYCGPNTGITLQAATSPWIHDVNLNDGTYDWTATSCITNIDNSVAGIDRGYVQYSDTNCMAHLVQANNYTITVTQTSAPIQASVWIDFDHSGSFEETERQNLTISGTTSTETIMVPATAVVGVTMMRVRIRSANIASACSQSGSGETEDYVIAITPGVTCSGTPVGGTTVTVDSICKNTPFNLSVQGATSGVIGLNYKWYQSTNNGTTWDSIPNSNSLTYTIPSISTNTCFKRSIRCNSGAEVFSSSVCVILKSQFQCYCGPNTGITLHSATSPSIDTVSLIYNGTPIYVHEDIGVSTTAPLGYRLFDDTSLAAHITQGENYTLLINNSAAPIQAAVWIDWDKSGTFESTEIFNITPNKNGTASIAVPVNASVGFTMMRVRIRSGSFTTACETFGSGETEDHIIKILPGTQCSGTPVGGTTQSTATTLCKNISFTLSVTGSSTAVGILGFTYQWQDSTVGGSWQNLTTASTGLVYTTTLSNVSRYFRRKITCANGNTFSYSTPILVNLNTPSYATLPYTESFENTWLDGCADAGSHSIPTNNWRTTPLTGDSSWRRNDDGASANWSNAPSGSYLPTGSVGTKSARLHTFSMAANASSSLDLYLNCTGGSTYKRLTFDCINVDGSDSLSILLSTDGGATFTRIDSVGNRSAWSNKKIDFASSSATTVIRFKGVSDGGVSTDIAIDNVSVSSLLPIDVAATAIISPIGSIGATNAGKVIVTIKNVGGSVLDFANTPVKVGAKGLNPNATPWDYNKTFNTGTLAINASMNDTSTITADFTTLGSWSIKGYAIIAGDGNTSNDSTNAGVFQVNSPAKVAVTSGFWGDGATWSGGTVPVATDTVNITGFTVTLSGGAQAAPYFCNSLGIGAGGTLIANADVLNIGPANGGGKAFNIASGGTLNISNATINHNGYILFNSGANFTMSGGALNVDGNDGTNVGSVQAGTDIFGIGSGSAAYTSGTLNITGGTITIVDPHRFGGTNAAFGYRGTVANNLVSGTNTLVLGSPTSNHTSSTGQAGFLLNLSTGGARLSLMNLTINGGNSQGNRFTTAQANIGINGNLTINANSELRNSFQTFVAGNLVNNGVFANGQIVNFQTFLSGTAGAVSNAQTISGSGIYRGNIPNAGLSSGGTGYSVGDILTLTGGTSITPLTIYVSAVNGTGTITNAVILSMGNYTVAPATTASAVTGGTGTGATFTSANVISTSAFSGITFNNTNTSGISISSFGTALAAQSGTISGTGTLTMKAGIINNAVPIVLGVSTIQRGSLVYTDGLITGKLTRWFSAATNATTSGDFPVGKGSICRNARIEFTTAPTKGGTLTAEYIATAPTTAGMPLTDGSVTLNNIANDGFWRVDNDTITGGNYTVSITDSGIVNAQTLATLRIVKRPSNTTNWTLDGVAGTNTGTLSKPIVVRTGLAGFSEFAIAGGADNLLPSTSMTLRGEKVRNTNLFNWAVVNEISVKGYELQRSADGRNFERVSFVNAKGNGTNPGTVNYDYTDNSSIYNDGYYRLKQISSNGSIAYSNVVIIKGLKVTNITIGNAFPNPTTDVINMLVASPKSGNVLVTITDMNGKLVTRQNKTLTVGDNTVSMNVHSLAAGNYMLTVTDLNGNKSNVVSFVKTN